MKTAGEFLENSKSKISSRAKTAFIACFVTGLITHMTVMVGDFPNHDGLASLYFDQNMITSGRWFLGTACGISSYFALPWLIGILSILYLSVSAAITAEVLELKGKLSSALVGAIMAAFPALASTFAYVFTMDGYMLGLLFGILAVFVTKKFRFGWIAGAVLLAFSMGTYQAYLPVVILLCMYAAVLRIAKCGGEGSSSKDTKKNSGTTGIEKGSRDSVKAKFFDVLHFLYMGVGGGALYFLILQVMLKIQGKVLDTYQGINTLDGTGSAAEAGADAAVNTADAAANAAGAASGGLLHKIAAMYRDFAAFTLKSEILAPNAFAWIAMGLLALAAAVLLVREIVRKKWYKSIWLYIIALLVTIVLPFASNIIMIISSDITYHALMRYQWVMFPVCLLGMIDAMTAGVSRTENKDSIPKDSAIEDSGIEDNSAKTNKISAVSTWIAFICATVLILCYTVTDNIGYSNLQKKYERTYAYCVRLLDRIEQTPGYYPGIPVAMIGVVSEDQYPKADLTGGVTDNLIGLSGDYLLYKNSDYELFIKNYLGSSLNMITGDEIARIYNSEEYILMDSFPAESSVKLVDGVIYVKTENIDHNLRDNLN